MTNYWIIVRHTYFSKLKTKSFIVTTILTLLIILGLTNLQSIMTIFMKDGNVESIAVIDKTDALFSNFQHLMYANHDDIRLQRFYGEEQEAIEAVKNKEYKGLLILSWNDEQLPEATYQALIITDHALSTSIQSSLQQLKLQLAAKQMNLSETQLTKLYEPVSFTKIALEKNAKSEEELREARGFVYILLFVIYIAVVMYANMIAMEVATEKSSRVMEILISSVSPIKLMFGKIVGIGLLGLTQLILLLAVAYSSLKQKTLSDEGQLFNYLGFGHIPLTFLFLHLCSCLCELAC